MGRITLYVKGELRLDRLNSRQEDMYALGVIGLAAVKERLRAGRDATDAQDSPLNKYYARLKAKITGRSATRDYSFGFERNARGQFVPTPEERQLLPNLRLRTVSETQVFADNTTNGNLLARKRARKNKLKQPLPLVGARSKNAAMQALYQRRHPGGEFLGFSPRNTAAVLAEANRLLSKMIQKAVIAK